MRWAESEQVVVLSNFHDKDIQAFLLLLPADLIKTLKLKDGKYELIDQLYGSKNTLEVKDGTGYIKISLNPLESFIYQVQ